MYPARDLLPQQPPYLLVDLLLSYDDDTSQASYVVQDVPPLTGFTLIVEHIAQTCAARIGYYNKVILHRPVQIGYVGAIPSLTVHRAPVVGEELLTTIQVLSSAFGLSLVHAQVQDRQTAELLAEGDIKIALSA